MTSENLQIQAYQAIRNQIIYSELPPGSKISEKNLEDYLKIGRTPIREALIKLRQENLVYTIPQSGTYISQIDLEKASNARFVREILESKIMIECCAKIDTVSSEELANLIEKQVEAMKNADSKSFFQYDNLFHQTCYRIANRLEIWNWMNSNNTHLERFRWLRLLTADLDWNAIIDQHKAIYHAIIQRNPEEVEFQTSLHLHMMLNEQAAVTKHFPEYFKN